MKNFKETLKNISNNRKISLASIILCLVLILSILVPTLANFMKEDATTSISVWDGSIASDFKSGDGTKTDPYIISSGAELAYFGYTLEQNEYDDTYFSISNNIILNEGTLKYNEETGIEYILNGETYYVEYYTNKYYDNPEKNGLEVGTVNIFNSFKQFRGHLEGNKNTIYGLYITDSNQDELSLFNKLEGNLENVFFKNSLVYGGIKTSGIAVLTNDTLLNNIIFDGYVVSKKEAHTKTLTDSITIDPITIYNYETTFSIDLKSYIPISVNNITSVKITGNYYLTGDANVLINNTTVTGGKFSLNLETLPDEIPVTTYTSEPNPVNLEFTNFNYEITYENSITSGLIIDAKNTVLNNVVNAANVLGNINSSGLIGEVTDSLEINQSYNRGTIKSSSTSSGLIGNVLTSNEIKISNSYNSGEIIGDKKAGLLGTIDDNSNIIIDKSFEGTSINPIGFNSNDITITESYITTEELNNGFINILPETIKNKDFLTTNLNFEQYTDEESNNIWYYELNEYPLNYNDYKLSEIVRLHAGTLSFKNYQEINNNQIIKNNITFTLEENNALDSIINKEFYVSEELELLNKDELNEITSWVTYDDVEQIVNEGKYIIYVKIENYKNEIKYINSDLLVLDLSAPNVELKTNNETWDIFNEEPDILYTNKIKNISLITDDELSGIAYIKYFISNNLYSEEELSLLTEEWSDYKDEIILDQKGMNIVYVKVIDNSDNIKYINSSYINYQGYVVTKSHIGLGNNDAYNGLPNHITNKSSFTLKFNYEEETPLIDNLNHYLVSNMLFPENTILKINDHVTKKVYSYQIPDNEDNYGYYESCLPEEVGCVKQAKYSFTLFKEIGKLTKDNYQEENYYNDNEYKESFTITVDFALSSTNLNYIDSVIYIETIDNDNNIIRSSILESLPKYSIYSLIDSSSSKANIYLTEESDINTINLNTNSVTEIKLSSGISYNRHNEFKIIDTSIENKYITYQIELLDSLGNIVSKDYLKNVVITVNDKVYFMDSDNKIRIPGKSIHEETKTNIKIITYEGNNKLDVGQYNFKISSLVSTDGYFDTSDQISILIPVTMSKNNYNNVFNVDMDTSVFNKINEIEKVQFNINQIGVLTSPNIRVSLYEKEELTAYNQRYNLVDLKNYINDNLEVINNQSYLVVLNEDKFMLNFKTETLNNTSYQLIFELYDNNQKIDIIKKHFIVR